MKKNMTLSDFLQAKATSPQVWPSLPPHIEARARAVWEKARPRWAPSFEAFEFQLTKDHNPESELVAWERISNALDAYTALHPAADRDLAQDLLGMISCGITGSKAMPPQRRKMLKELRGLYLQCSGAVTPITITANEPSEIGEGTDVSSPQDILATSIEQVAEGDVMRSDLIFLRDSQTQKCFLLYPETIPPLADMQREAKRKVPFLMIEFDQDNEHHKELAGNILKIAKGEVQHKG